MVFDIKCLNYITEEDFKYLSFMHEIANLNPYGGLAGDFLVKKRDEIASWLYEYPKLHDSFITIGIDGRHSVYGMWVMGEEKMNPIAYFDANGEPVLVMSSNIREFLAILCTGAKRPISVDEDNDIFMNEETIRLRQECAFRFGIFAPNDYGRSIKENALGNFPDLWQWILDNGIESE